MRDGRKHMMLESNEINKDNIRNHLNFMKNTRTSVLIKNDS